MEGRKDGTKQTTTKRERVDENKEGKQDRKNGGRE